jgi:uncharacterized protein YbjT (DUF2867 family)
MRVAVTGATGFVGRHIVRSLLDRGHHVTALLRPSPASRLPAGVEPVPGSLDNASALRALATGADVVVHLVGIIEERGTATFQAVHVDGTRHLVAAARTAEVRRFIYMSAMGARDAPSATAYHRTKAQAEEIVRAVPFPGGTVVFRPSLISGPENVPLRLLARLHRWLPAVPVFGDGSYPTQPVWVGDVALAFALAAERPGHLSGEFELGGPDRVTYAGLLRAIGRASGHPRPLVHVPLGLIRAAARVFDHIPGAPLTSDQLQMLTEGSDTPNNAITSAFGIRPVGLQEGLERYLGKKS